MTNQLAEGEAPPALFEHCCRVYEAMRQEAAPQGERGVMVYEGFLTRLITVKLNLSVPYYTTIRKQLIRMGCIRQLKRGGGTAASQWELIYEPTEEAFFRAVDVKPKPETKVDLLSKQVNDLSNDVSELQIQMEQVIGTLADHFGTEPARESV